MRISELQQYLREKDYGPEHAHEYFLKLVEEVGELANSIRQRQLPATEETFKGSVEEELWDVIYYTLCIANIYGIDVEKWIPVKERLNDAKYGNNYSVTLPRKGE